MPCTWLILFHISATHAKPSRASHRRPTRSHQATRKAKCSAQLFFFFLSIFMTVFSHELVTLYRPLYKYVQYTNPFTVVKGAQGGNCLVTGCEFGQQLVNVRDTAYASWKGHLVYFNIYLSVVCPEGVYRGVFTQLN